MGVVNPQGVSSAKSELTASLTITYNFARQHMKSAIQFAKQAGKIEADNSGKACGPFFEELRTYVSSAIILSVCALEATINEHLAASNGILKGYDADLRGELFALIEKKRVSLKEKYDLGLILNKKPKLGFDKEPFQSLKCLIALRNALVHYKPESDKDLKDSEELRKKLRSKIKDSPFVSKTDNFLTKRAMSYSCAKWAVNTALNFSREYSKILDIGDKFSNLRRL